MRDYAANLEFEKAAALRDELIELRKQIGGNESLIVPVRLADLQLPAPRPLRCGLRVDKVKRLLGAGVPLPLDAALDRFLAERAA